MKKVKLFTFLLLLLSVTTFAQTVTKLSTDQYSFVEGPTWDGTDNIYFTDVNGNSIIKYSTSKKTFKTLVSSTKKANGMMYNTDNTLVVCEGDAGSLAVRDTNGVVLKTLTSTYGNIRYNSPNDLCIDGKGGIYFSDPTWNTMYQTQNRLYYRNALGTVAAVITDMSKPNGIIVSADGKTLFVDDSWSTTIRAYDIQSDGTLLNKKTFALIKLVSATDNISSADGMALDKSGNLYVACKLGILVYNSAGVLVKTITLPETASNCIFGGKSMNTLYITAGKNLYSYTTTETGFRHPFDYSVLTGTVAITGVGLSSSTLALATSATSQLTATIAPTNATNKTVTWTTSNATVATVNATGLVTSVNAGSATITATTQDGGKVATCAVTVTAAGTFSLKIEAESYSSMFGVQTQTTTDVGVGLNVGYLDPNDWMVYNTITISTTGTYTISYRIASLAGGGKLQLEANAGATILDPAFTIPSTGGWQNWQTVTRTITLQAGTYNLRLKVVTGGFNINYFTITKTAGARIAANSEVLSDDQPQGTNIVFYPNPTTDDFTLLKEEEGNSVLNISDISGKSAMDATISQGSNLINISNLKSGMYIIQYQSGVKLYKSKLMKVH